MKQTFTVLLSDRECAEDSKVYVVVATSEDEAIGLLMEYLGVEDREAIEEQIGDIVAKPCPLVVPDGEEIVELI